MTDASAIGDRAAGNPVTITSRPPTARRIHQESTNAWPSGRQTDIERARTQGRSQWVTATLSAVGLSGVLCEGTG